MKAIKIHSKQISIHCNDLEKTINKDGCYDAKGSTICRVCSVKPSPKKVKTADKENKI
ncbi:MAG: hypothetical protein AB1499_12310 [Nitrospirota bacterium]